jgi:hypothetical protein
MELRSPVRVAQDRRRKSALRLKRQHRLVFFGTLPNSQGSGHRPFGARAMEVVARFDQQHAAVRRSLFLMR